MSIDVRSRSPLARDLQPVRVDTNMSVLIGVRITCEKFLFPLVCFNNIKSERFIYILRGFVIKQLLQSPLFIRVYYQPSRCIYHLGSNVRSRNNC